MSLTEDQIISLAPDASSLNAGKELATVSKWQVLGVSDKALWGHCQGSGKLPYQTQVDLLNTAFKCSCPSRKFPCKHAMALLLLHTRQPGSFTREKEPDWVSDWLEKRTERITGKAAKETKTPDTLAQLKRVEARNRKVASGIDDLQVWIKDIIRNGLLALHDRSHEFWQNTAKRMIDAQAPGLAAMVRALGDINYFNESWKHEVLNLLSRLFLISEGYRNLDSLPENFRWEIRSLVGFTQSKEDILAQQGIADRWLVLARTLEDDEQLTIERNWLYGVNTKRFALILQFFANKQQPELSFMPGTSIHGELVFYAGVHSYRALLKHQQNWDRLALPEFHPNIAEAMQAYGNIISENPLYDRIPLFLANVRFLRNQYQYYLVDEQSEGIKVNTSEAAAIKLLAVTGGRKCQVFVLLNENEAEPLAVWASNNFITLTDEIQR